MSRLILLTTSPRVAPGLLCSQAWEALHQADSVFTRDPAHPQAPYLGAAGIPVRVLQDDASALAPMEEAQLATELLDAARAGTVLYLAGQDGDPELGRALADQLPRLAEAGQAPELEVLPGSWDLPGARLMDLVAVMHRLRSPGGCPWDAQQTHKSLVTYLVEETYETLEAIESGDLEALREELGDLLLQVIFHSRLAEESPEHPWSIDDVATGVVDKLRRRHPHVFGPQAAGAEDDVLESHGGVLSAEHLEHLETTWQQLKAAEKARDSVLDGVPLAQPALSLAAKMVSRVERGGLAVSLEDENPGTTAAAGDAEARIGASLLSMVVDARRAGVDPEAALRAALRGYAERVRAVERRREGAAAPS
jgi:XTP/dITP diphosphohydrolase